MDDDPLLGWGLKPVELTDQATLDAYFKTLREPLSDYTFSQLFTWRNSLRILWKEIHGHLCVFANGAGDLTLLMPPIGDTHGDNALTEAFELMNTYNAAKGVADRSRVEYASEELLARFDRSALRVEPLGCDYLYDMRKMIDLPGGDLASKRQAKNRFLRNYVHRVETYSAPRHLEDCRCLLRSWKQHQDVQHRSDFSASAVKRQKEALACDLTLEWAHELGLAGMVVYVTDPASGQESLRGFTFGELLGHDQSSIVIEKTDLEIKGLAQFIFSEFCRRHWSQRPRVNVGDDWGLETLAWTKNSYRPVKLLSKCVLRRTAATQVCVAPPVMKQVPAPVVRLARKTDLAAAVALEQSCFDAYCLSKRQLQYLQQRSSALFLVAEDAGKIVGEGISLIRQHKRGPSGRIYSLAVDHRCRGQKIGRRLLQKMVDELSAKGVSRIYLEVEQSNATAVKLYEHQGFRRLGVLPDYYGPGRPGLRMVLQAQVAAACGA